MNINESFLKYAASYSGIDGGDINAEYWFMGMEWSNIDDIKDHYDEEKNIWIEQTDFPDEEIDIEEKKEGKDVWKLEKKMDELYQKLKLKNKVSGKTIFQKNSNSLKLNVLPLPFSITDAHNDEWLKYEYAKKTGFEFFYQYRSGVLAARHELFQKLLQTGKKPKTIFCFGKEYKKEFIYALTGEKDTNEEPEIILENSKTPVFVYNIKSDKIKKIIVCYFPTRFHFKDKDWEQICTLAEK